MRNNNCFSFAEQKFLQMTNFFKSNDATSLNLSEVEEYLQQDGRELLWNLLIGYIKERGVGDIGSSVTVTDGIKIIHKRIITIKSKFYLEK